MFVREFARLSGNQAQLSLRIGIMGCIGGGILIFRPPGRSDIASLLAT